MSSESEYIDYTCKCGKKCRSHCPQQWQRDYVNANLICDRCLIDRNPLSVALDPGEARDAFNEAAKWYHEQIRMDEICLNM